MLNHAALAKLRQGFSGELLLPGDRGYDCVRPWTLRSSQQHNTPLVVLAHSVDDIASIISFAQEEDYQILTHVTGHGSFAVKDGKKIILVPSLQTGVTVDPTESTVTLSGGSRWLDVNTESVKHGLIGLHGLFPWVGVVGYALFGGVGPAVRLRGLAVDSILEMDVVTSNGKLQTIRPGHDLYWAMCGGGASPFGVVTRIKMRLYPLVPIQHLKITALIRPGDASLFLERFRDWTAQTPRNLTSLLAFRCGLDASQECQETLGMVIEGYWCGESDKGILSSMSGWTKLSGALIEQDTLKVIPKDVSAPPCSSYSTMTGGFLLPALTDEAIAKLVEFGACETMFTDFIIRHIGGAINEVSGHNACALRDAGYSLSMYARIETDNDEEALRVVTSSLYQSLSSSFVGIYLNYMIPTMRDEYYQRALRQAYQRIRAINDAYDSRKLFGGIPR